MAEEDKGNNPEINFKDYYFSKYVEENHANANPYETCSAARNSMVRIYSESTRTLSNESTCLLLKDGLSEYSQLLFDDTKPDSVNGFAKPIEYLLKGKVQTSHCSSWKSNLSTSKIDPVEIMKDSLEKIGHCNIKNNLPCTSDSTNEDDFQMLIEPKQLPDLTKTLKELNIPILELVKKDKAVVQRSNVIPSTSRNGAFVPKTLSKRPNDSENFIETAPTAIKKPAYENRVPLNQNIAYKKAQFQEKPSYDQPKPSTSKFSANTNPVCVKKPHQENNHSKELSDEVVQMANPFRSARNELMIQNKKKYGNPHHNMPYENNNGQKRSLGTTRSGGASKFVPPFSANECEKMETDEPLVDERLKHIDPKMVELIMSEIVDSSAAIGWDDIAGLEFAKTAVQEAVVWPLLRPDIFTGLRRPPKGILLFGPPGTGKTLIGKCIASQCNATFFSISASSLTSKWIGDGEKMVRALFAVARCHQPAVVFIDEIDSLLTQRSDAEHEATRRIKTEFLVQLDGAAIGDEDRILLVGATNRPQELDEAARRRLVKRLYIPLPDLAAREQIVRRLMTSERHSLTDEHIESVAKLAEGFSGADMRSLCGEAALGPIRSVPLSQISNIDSEQVRPVDVNDFHNALKRVRPSVSGDDLEHYVKWDRTYGSGSAAF